MLLDLITSTVEEATDCASLNEAMKTVFAYEPIYDSLLRAQKAVAKKGNDLKLVYNKSRKQYEPAEI
jgi:hypothetical protein